jgi:hypothetical protein
MYFEPSTEIEELIQAKLPGGEDDDWDDEDDESFDDWIDDEDDLHEIQTDKEEFGDIDPEDDDHLPDDDL